MSGAAWLPGAMRAGNVVVAAEGREAGPGRFRSAALQAPTKGGCGAAAWRGAALPARLEQTMSGA